MIEDLAWKQFCGFQQQRLAARRRFQTLQINILVDWINVEVVSDVTHVLLSLLVIIVVVVIVVLLPVGSRGGLDRGMLQGYKDLEKSRNPNGRPATLTGAGRPPSAGAGAGAGASVVARGEAGRAAVENL